jgi:hypothetical protein
VGFVPQRIPYNGEYKATYSWVCFGCGETRDAKTMYRLVYVCPVFERVCLHCAARSAATFETFLPPAQASGASAGGGRGVGEGGRA